ncbi:MAG: M66 family metalloprotease [Gemmatimonadota bacterium]|nr:M66 family metalloprotease [Gemmatimonadota bacterium]MDE2865573.1 M66 family metalloprotease [Gemmatimonadota bacterium]
MILPADTMLMVGERVQYSVVVLDQNGEPIEPLPSWAQPVWESANPATLHIGPDGSASAVDYAETEVKVSFAGMRARTPVRVNPTQLTLTAPYYYLTQGIQNKIGGVPLIEGRDALLRVFVTGDRLSYYQPRVEALFFRDDALIHGVAISPRFRRLPTEVDEGRLEQSYNALIPSSVIAQGIDLEIRLDLHSVVPTTPESRLRIPAEGRVRLDVRAVPRLDLVVVPIVAPSDPAAAIRQWTGDITPGSQKLQLLRSVLPVKDLSVRVHEGFVTTANLAMGAGWGELLTELVLLRIREGEQGYYYGAVQLGADAIWDGLGQIGYPASVGRPDPVTLTHELGHNMGLRHAPCGGAIDPDPAYPYDGGAIGAWGYDFESERVINATLYKDLMGYCDPVWISDYHFSRAMGYRLFREEPAPAAAALDWPAASQRAGDRTLLLWGRADLDGLILDPAFMVDAPVSLPTEDGPYRLEGLGPRGERRFSLSFQVWPLEYGGGNFVFTVPFDPDRDGALERVVFSGPEGSYTLEQFGSRPMAMVTERGSGKLRAVLRDWDGAWPRTLPFAEGDSEVVVSEGLPF